MLPLARFSRSKPAATNGVLLNQSGAVKLLVPAAGGGVPVEKVVEVPPTKLAVTVNVPAPEPATSKTLSDRNEAGVVRVSVPVAVAEPTACSMMSELLLFA